VRTSFISGRQDRLLGAALGLSLALHVALLAVHFKFPAGQRPRSEVAALEVVLVNAKTRSRPVKAEVLAQSNLDRGGNVDEPRRAKTPLPVTEPRAPGRDFADAQRRQQALESRQQELLAQMRAATSKVPAAAPRPRFGFLGLLPIGLPFSSTSVCTVLTGPYPIN